MRIIEHDYNLGRLAPRLRKPKYLVFHHSASKVAAPQDVNRWHKARGWSGIGYHYLVRKDGSIHRGRPENKLGAHVRGHNSDTIGICAEGDFTRETMSDAQIAALQELRADIHRRYPGIKDLRHSDLNPTSCPGNRYPWRQVTQGKTAPLPKPPTRSEMPTIRRGAHGAVVRTLQKELNQHGFKVAIDGDFGPRTERAVRGFQRKCHLGVDGIVGPRTWKALGL